MGQATQKMDAQQGKDISNPISTGPTSTNANSTETALSSTPKVGSAPKPALKQQSLMQLLQDECDSSRLARLLICSAGFQVRNIVFNIVTMGLYYSMHRRRIDMNRKWKSTTVSSKMKTSIAVWMPYVAGNIADSQQQEEFVDKIVVFLQSCWRDADEGWPLGKEKGGEVPMSPKPTDKQILRRTELSCRNKDMISYDMMYDMIYDIPLRISLLCVNFKLCKVD